MIFYWLFSFVFGPSVENARSITRASQTSIANLRSRMVKKKRNKGEQTHFYPRERELRMEKEKKTNYIRSWAIVAMQRLFSIYDAVMLGSVHRAG
jgi:hypothetical protein